MSNKKINILQVPVLRYPEIIGGVDTMVNTLIEGIKDQTTVTVFIPSDWSQKSLSIKKVHDTNVYSIRLRMPFEKKHPLRNLLSWLIEFPQTISSLRKIIKDNDIDLIHLHVAKSFQYYFIFLKYITKTPYVLTLHGTDVVGYNTLSYLERFFVRQVIYHSNHVNTVSKHLASLTKKKFPKIKHISHVNNGINLKYTLGVLSNIKDKPFNEPYFIMVGSFDPYKGHITAIEAWKYLKKTTPNIHLIIAGEGELQPEYEAIIKKNNCQDHIHLIGQVSHSKVMELLKFSKGMIFPSINEGLGYVLLEAGVASIPVICTAIYPFLEFIKNEQNGLIVPVNDSAAIANAVKKIVENPQWAHDLANHLNEIICKEFSSEKMAEGYLNIYNDILN